MGRGVFTKQQAHGEAIRVDALVADGAAVAAQLPNYLYHRLEPERRLSDSQ